ncbi:MAG: hypothetical protein M3155_04885 [Actinomycetota bacterium]|nr:hypothetical protein [Actinomycetota bacterium]
MTAVLSLLAGLALGVALCALLVLLIARIGRRQWRRALVYFGLGDDPELVDDERPLEGLASVEPGSFDWPAERGRPVRRA